jgi:hypothetical protein
MLNRIHYLIFKFVVSLENSFIVDFFILFSFPLMLVPIIGLFKTGLLLVICLLVLLLQFLLSKTSLPDLIISIIVWTVGISLLVLFLISLTDVCYAMGSEKSWDALKQEYDGYVALLEECRLKMNTIYSNVNSLDAAGLENRKDVIANMDYLDFNMKDTDQEARMRFAKPVSSELASSSELPSSNKRTLDGSSSFSSNKKNK